MKTIVYLSLILIFFSCSKKENKETQNNSNTTTTSADIKNYKGEVVLFLGIHNIEYFADRMVLKSKLAGYDFAKKTSLGPEKWKVELGPFKSFQEAEKADKAIKQLAPDTVSRILKK